MKFKCNYLKQDKVSQSGILYKILQSRKVIFEEEETKDRVIVNYNMGDKQYGICSSEYKPPFVDDEGMKKADILVMLIDEGDKKFSSWVLDIKQSVGGEDVIFHLLEQLGASLKHKNALAVYLDDFEEEEHLGFVTRSLQIDRIEATIEKKKRELNKREHQILIISPILGNKLAATQVPKLKKEIEILSLFLERKMKIREKIYPIESYISEKQGDYFVCNLTPQLRH